MQQKKVNTQFHIVRGKSETLRITRKTEKRIPMLECPEKINTLPQ